VSSSILDAYRDYPYFDRASDEVDAIMPPDLHPVERDDVRTLMILAWMRGAAWQSHDTH
jgi:hypothetical protein